MLGTSSKLQSIAGEQGCRKVFSRCTVSRENRTVAKSRSSKHTPFLPVVNGNVLRRSNFTACRSAPSAKDSSATTATIGNTETPHGNAGAVTVEATPGRTKTPRKIVFVSSEAAPWSKTGGLGDVLSSLPIALAARGHRVMVVTPRYADYKEITDTKVKVDINGNEVGYFHQFSKGVDWVFVDHPSYPRPGGIYNDKFGVYGDNQFRFALLCLAGLEAPLHLKFEGREMYGQDVVFMANDWHTALVPVYLAAKYRANGTFRDARALLAIHNLAHQGVFPPGTFPSLWLPDHWYGSVEWQYPPHQRLGAYEEQGRCVNTMKAGLACADRIVTVSAGYAEEVKSYLGGWGLESVLNDRTYVLNGITNGIDMDEWDPSKDPHLPQTYDINSFQAGKAACKMALQKELGLPVNAGIPLIAFIGRLDNQKGADILLGAAPEILERNDVQLVCLGTGNKDLEDGLRWLEASYKNKARGWVGFNVPLSHRLTAAADILLMPSRFEPCGLNQLYAMRYGTVPVAHKTGGLKDTVVDFDPWKQSGTGWTYTNCDPAGLVWAVGIALQTMRAHRSDFEGLQRRGMQRDSSWDTAAQQYEQIIEWAKMDKPWCG